VPKTLRLTADAISYRKSPKGDPLIYGKKGQTVKLISERGGVFIVENDKGIRFPVKRENTDAENLPG
jgi:hypothetical protein